MAKKFIRNRVKVIVIAAFDLDEHDVGRYTNLKECLNDDDKVTRLKSMLKKEFGTTPKKSDLKLCADIDDIADEVEEVYDPNEDPRHQ